MTDEARRAKLIGSALGLGYLPVAPGTWASVAAAALYWVIRASAGAAAAIPASALLCLATVAVGVGAAARAEKAHGARDPGPFVLDELAGQWLTYALFWWGTPVLTAALGFLTFRFFDIAKPFPLRRLEKLPDGWGVMADDLGAALYAAALSWVLGVGLLAHLPG